MIFLNLVFFIVKFLTVLIMLFVTLGLTMAIWGYICHWVAFVVLWAFSFVFPGLKTYKQDVKNNIDKIHNKLLGD